MTVKVYPFKTCGTVAAPPSKSFAHRFLIAAALKKGRTVIKNIGSSADVMRTCDCLTALGAKITIENGNAEVYGIENPVEEVVSGSAEVVLNAGEAALNEEKIFLKAGESGSTLRFLMPVVAALGKDAKFVCEKSLLSRPMEELVSVLESRGAKIEKLADGYSVSGKIRSGEYVLSGEVSSQYASGLAFALPLLSGESSIVFTGELVSKSYFDMTCSVLSLADIEYKKEGYKSIIEGKCDYNLPDEVVCDGDFSASAYLLCLGAVYGDVTVTGIKKDGQGDEEIVGILKKIGAEVVTGENRVRVKKREINPAEIDCSSVPDLVPALCAVLCYADGKSVLKGVSRLKFKESDRVKACVEMCGKLGVIVELSGDNLIIFGGNPKGGAALNGYGDHRMVMAGVIAAAGLKEACRITDAEKVDKSYPDFFGAVACLGGKIDVSV